MLGLRTTNLKSLLYPMISKKPGSNDNIIERFAKQIGTDFVTLEFEHAAYPVPILKTYSRQYFAPSGS